MDGGYLKSIHQAKPLYTHAAQETRSSDAQILMAREGQGRIKDFWGPKQQTFWGPCVHAGADLLSLLTRYPIDILIQ